MTGKNTQILSASRAGLSSVVVADSGTDDAALTLSDLGAVDTEASTGALSTLLPGFVDDVDSFFAPTVANQLQFLIPALHNDADVFPVPIIARIPFTQTLQPSLVTDVDHFFIHTVGGSRTLSLLLWNDQDLFYVPNVALIPIGKQTQTLTVTTRVDELDVIYPPKIISGILRPGLVSDQDVFYVPAFTVGSVNVVPGLFVDDDVFFVPVVARGLQPQLFVDEDTIYGADVIGRNVLLPSVVSDVDVFLEPQFSLEGELALVDDDDVIFAADVGWQIEAAFEDDSGDEGDIFPPVLDVYFELRPPFLVDEDTIETYPFFVQSITGGTPVTPPPGVLGGDMGRKSKVLTGVTRREGANKVLTGKVGKRAA